MRKVVIFGISNRGGGSETFLKEFIKRDLSKKNFDVYLFISEDKKDLYKNLNKNIKIIPIEMKYITNPLKRIVYENFIAYKKIKQINPELIFIPSESIPYRWKRLKAIKVTNVHSTLQSSSLKNFITRSIKENYEYYSRKRSFKQSNHIVFVSYYSYGEIRFKFNVDDNKCSIIYHGVTKNHYNKKEISQLGKYILSVGDRHNHKKYYEMIRLFYEFDKKYNKGIKLVIVGRKISNDVDNEINKLIKELGINDKIIFIENISYEEVSNYYKNALLYITTSSWESFGLTLLEAMSNNLPVIAYKSSSLVEIYKDKVKFIDPRTENTTISVDKIYRMLYDEELIKHYKNVGKDFVDKMSWEKSIQKYILLFDNLLEDIE